MMSQLSNVNRPIQHEHDGPHTHTDSAKHGLGAKRCHIKMSLSPSVKHRPTDQVSGGELCDILIVSAVNICKQCLQTVSASGDPYWGFDPGPHFCPPRFYVYSLI